MPINDYFKNIAIHLISTLNERLTSGFRPPDRPDHTGMDFTDADRLELRQDVYILAFEDGVVVFAGMGNYVDIRHEFKSSAEGNNGKKYLTRYCHFKSASPFKTGQTVKKGDVIGVMGTTGNSTGVHLHFGLKENSVSWNTGTWVNPEPYLTGERAMRTVEPVKIVDTAIKVGDRVKIKMGAKYYTGGTIPAWVASDTWIISSLNGDRAVIDKNVSGKNSIMSPINVKDLLKM